MGMQCNIILSYHTHLDIDNENFIIDKIRGFGVPMQGLKIQNEGNRAFEPTMHVICMKNWHEEECDNFFNFLRTIEWDFPESVQIYYTPAHDDDWKAFKYFPLFPRASMSAGK